MFRAGVYALDSIVDAEDINRRSSAIGTQHVVVVIVQSRVSCCELSRGIAAAARLVILTVVRVVSHDTCQLRVLRVYRVRIKDPKSF
jgi:hypothetical protein